MTTRRSFINKSLLGGAGLVLSNTTMGMAASSYRNIIGANERLHVAISGLGRRVGAYYEPVARKESNVRLTHLCDVMEKSRLNALKNVQKHIDYKPNLENDIRKVLEDKNVDVLLNATPDHWHTPGSIMALKADKHVYVEKPCSHNMNENELLVAASKKYGKYVQMGNQQRSSVHTIDIIDQIHKGVIGKPYKAIAFYSNSRGETPLQQKAEIPKGLDWDLWQGPAPHRAYTSETWDYNWHWYGWNYGTAEAGNNGTHELDIARWALGVEFPSYTEVLAEKRHFKDDGWEMYDTMYATFKFKDDKIIHWDGKSRNGYNTYGRGRGTLIFGTEGSVLVDRSNYLLMDREGKLITKSDETSESGIALGGGGNSSTAHIINFFESIRGKENLKAPIEDAAVSMAMVHYANMAYRVGHGFRIDNQTGGVEDQKAMELWNRSYEPGWEPKI